ncbi:hypothetical protein CHPC974_001249 [Lactococcus phage CHPC974]|nr:hypothetical protein CHPC974_001249 [Lactococcus phage CHPC974]
MKNQEKTINHLGQVVYQESVEFYKEKLSVYSKDFLKNSGLGRKFTRISTSSITNWRKNDN